MNAGAHRRTQPFGIGDQRPDGRDRLDRALPGGVDGKRRHTGEIRLDATHLVRPDHPDVIAPSHMLGAVRFEPGFRHVPQQPAGPGERQAGQILGQPAPLAHGAGPQLEIGARIAPARIDPGERVRRSDAARLAFAQQGDPSAGLRQMPCNGGTDDAGADDDDFPRCHEYVLAKRNGDGDCLRAPGRSSSRPDQRHRQVAAPQL